MGLLNFPDANDPEGYLVQGAGQGEPLNLQNLKNYGLDLLRAGKGLLTGATGIAGDTESLGRGLLSIPSRSPDQSRFGAFLSGLEEPTLLPTSKDINRYIDPLMPQSLQGEAGVPQQIGEFMAPGGLLMKAAEKSAPMVKKGLLSLPTDLPVGASVKPVVNAPVSDIGMYSALEEAGLNLQRNKGTGQAFLNDLLKAPNVKQEEVRWIGLDDYLKDKPNATKQDVQNFIANNRVDVQEVMLDSSKTVEREKLKEASHQALQRVDEMIPGLSSLDRANLTTFWAPSAQAGNASDLAAIRALNLSEDQMQAVMEYGAAVNRQRDFIESSNGYMAQPKFGQYTLPGGENYREILLTMPEPMEAKMFRDLELRVNAGERLKPEELQKYYALVDAQAFKGQFYGSHWDQPNVLAHLRVNDRVDADGKKMLLVEEVQSDWHQAGRDKGYKSDVNPEENKALVKQWDTLANERRDLERIVAVGDDADPAVQIAVQRLGEISNELNAVNDRLTQIRTTFREGVPDAPFKDNWYQLALKRAIKYAADNGYDRIGLTTGSRQAERYDLSKQIGYLAVIPKKNDMVRVVANKDGVLVFEKVVPKNQLADYVGKDMAKKAISDIDAGKNAQYSDLDLKIGGEGMKKYYDEIYPQFLAKYGKKWGAKVGETSIKTSNKQDVSPSQVQGWDLGGLTPEEFVRKYNTKDNEPVRYIDITPEMKKSVKKGQPLFAAVPAVPLASTYQNQGESSTIKQPGTNKKQSGLLNSF